MKSFLHPDYYKYFNKLPKKIQEQSRKSYKLFKENPNHTSLHFKKVHPTKPFYSVRISKDWRVVGYLKNNDMYWFWTGSHSDYDGLISQI